MDPYFWNNSARTHLTLKNYVYIVCNIDDANAFAFIMLLDCMYYAMEVQMMLMLLCLVSANHVYVCSTSFCCLLLSCVDAAAFLAVKFFSNTSYWRYYISAPQSTKSRRPRKKSCCSVCPVVSCGWRRVRSANCQVVKDVRKFKVECSSYSERR